MDIGLIFGTIISFVKLLFLVSIISFICYKLFAPLRKKVEDRFSLSWTKSCLVFNFGLIFIFLLLLYIYFMGIGVVSAPIRTEEIDYDLVDNVFLVLVSIPRLLVASFILTLILYFFELVASFFMREKSSKKSNSKSENNWVSQFKGVLVASALFLVLFLFVFNWVPLGLFVYIFYGSIKALPVLLL